MIRKTPFSLSSSALAQQLLAGTVLENASPMLGRWFERDLGELARLGSSGSGPALFTRILECLKIGYTCEPDDRARIPASGPLIVVANHPFGLVEGPVLWAALSAVRKDIKFLANSVLAVVPELGDMTIPVDPFGHPDAVRANWKPVRGAIRWLRDQHVLVVFPAGEVASLRWPRLHIADPVWNDRISHIIRLTGASVLPVFLHGTNSPFFHLAGLIHPRLRTILLPHELLNKRGATIRLSIGSPIRPNRLAPRPEGTHVTGYLRMRTMLLGARGRRQAIKTRMRLLHPQASPAAVVEAEHRGILRKEIEQLAAADRVAASGNLAVYVAMAERIPHILREIGRLREITFRGAGEGSGRAIDIDAFDQHYHHLFLWNHEKDEVVGAYRFAKTDEVSRRDLYTTTLFRTAPGFLTTVSPALELGRSFVRAEYQRSYQPLLLLWKAIGQVVAADPRYRFLFGPVSISQSYAPSSRALITSYLRARYGNEDLAAYIKPRRRYRVRGLGDWDWRSFSAMVGGLDELSEMVADLEPDHKAVPILLRQYLNLGGRIVEFNVDARFSNVLDGLVVVDLTKTSPKLLERYLGQLGSERFRSHHGLDCRTGGGRADYRILKPPELPGRAVFSPGIKPSGHQIFTPD